MINIRSEEEIESIRKACRIAAQVLEELMGYIKPGITTKELDEIGERLIRKKEAYPAFKGYRGYGFATCISLNHEVVHGIPSNKKIKEGDIVSLDVGVKLGRFYGDIARTFAVGEVGKKAKKLLKVSREALYLGIRQARPGNHLGDVSYAIQSHAEKNGFSVVRDLFGHGIGEELHEEPLVPNFGNPGEGPELKPGMVFAIEPMLNIGKSDIETLSDGWTVVTKDGELSAHFEHTVALTKSGPIILTELN